MSQHGSVETLLSSRADPPALAADYGRKPVPSGQDTAPVRPASLPLCRIRRGVRLHPVPRMNMCLVHTPDSPTVHTLSRNAWRLLELCALEDLPRIRSTFLRSFAGDRSLAQSRFEHHLAELVALGIVRLV